MSAYNHEKYVGEAIESVCKQTYSNIEFLVADDCSTDNTVEEIMRYENNIDEIHLFDTNAGERVTFLSETARGKYIALISSDDVWEKDKIRQQVRYMENHPECAACFTGGQCIAENGEEMDLQLFLKDNKKKEQWMKHFFTYGNCLAHPSVLIRRECYLGLLHSGTGCFRQLPDFWYWVKLVQEKEIHVIEKNLIRFRFHEAGENANTSARTQENAVRHARENAYLWYDTIKKMENNYFKKVFQKEFILKNASDNAEISCEKFFVLKNNSAGYMRQTALFFLYDIWQDKETAKVLQEKYNFTIKDIYQLSGN